MREIVRLALELAQAVETFTAHARAYCYLVTLSGHVCPQCGGGLAMLGESRCQCVGCAYTFDPTVAFQACPDCGGGLRLRICRYRCRRCGRDVRSRFVFDGHVLDPAYFRVKMAESRERRQQRRAGLQELAAANRSNVVPLPAIDLEALPGLAVALDGLLPAPDIAAWLPILSKGFDLPRYEAHLQAQLGAEAMRFDDLLPLDQNPRLDRIWRFVALIFMAHAGLLELEQQGVTILVIPRGNDNEGQGVSGEVEAVDGVA
jgi:hypothetical protein